MDSSACPSRSSSGPDSKATWPLWFWNKAYRDWNLTGEEQSACADRGLREIDRALGLKADFVEAMVYRGLLLRVKAKAVTNAALEKRLMDEVATIQERVQALRSSGVLPHPGAEPGAWPR